MNLVLKVAVGIIPVVLVGCSGSNAGSVLDAGPTAGATSGTQTSTVVVQTSGGASGVAGVGGATGTGGDTGGSSDAGSKASTTATSVTAGTSAAGGGGSTSTSGMSSSTAGGQGGKSTGGSGGASAAGGTSAQGGSGSAGKTSDTVTGGSTNLGGSVGGTSVSGGSTTVGSRTGPTLPPRFVGNLDTAGKIRPDFSKYWDQFTPESAGHWAAVQGSGRSTFNWNSLDTMYAYTQENNIVFKESCFIWGAGPPSWANSSNIVEAAQIWMKTFCERYPNTRLIDVVNEPLHMTPGYAPGLGGGGGTTWEWVANSFKMAREACPNAVLILNDYNLCEYETDHQRILALMSAMKKLDAPIDAIGCQSHDAGMVSVSKFKGYLDDLASQTGLPIYITEFDIGLADDEKQRAQYADYFTMFWDNPNVKGATIWGYIVGKTWRANTGIMGQDGTMRPAMSWLMDFLHR
jgi:endo-1,4-beta-xylanase